MNSIKKSEKPVKAVLFDLDETLIDSVQGHVGAHIEVCKILKKFLKKNKISINEKNLLSEISKLDDEMNKKFKYDRDEWWPKLLDNMALNVKLPLELIKNLTRSYWFAYASSAKPYPDAKTILQYLKKRGFLLGLLSDTDRLPGMKRYRIDIQPFKNLFDLTLVAGEETKDTKPSPEPFLTAAKKLGVKPEECLFVGDKPFADTKGAKEAGMKTVLVHRRDWGMEVQSDFIVRSLKELEDILR